MIDRRRFVVVTGSALLAAAPRFAALTHAQPPGKVYRVGVLGSTSPTAHGAFVDAFREGLRERGYVEGKNVSLEYRWAAGDYTRLPALAAELVRMNVDLILTHGTPGGRAAREATTTIPIVIAIVGDAVQTGLVESLAKPGGNVTGSSFFFSELNAKRVELLKEALPGVKRIAVLVNDSNPGNVATFEAMARTARTARVEIVRSTARTAEDFADAFARMTKTGIDGVCVYEDALFIAQAPRLAALAEQHRLPSIGFREYAEAGGLLGFGINFPDVWRRAAGYADRIFKGAKPSDLPIEQPGKFDTVVNLRTAKALRLTIPPKILLRAESVIDP